VILASLLSSYPRIGDRPEEQILRRAIASADRGEAPPSAVAEAEDAMTRLALRDQSEAGLDLLSDGQIRWHDAVSHVARGLAGLRIEGLLRYFDTNTYYRQPAATGPIGRERPILVEAYRFAAAAVAPRPVKGIVTGPITIARLSRDARGLPLRHRALEIASALNRELLDLEAAGAPVLQIDEPCLARFPGDLDLLGPALRRLVAGLTGARVALSTSFGDALPLLPGLVTLPVSLLGFDIAAMPSRSTETAEEIGTRLAAGLPPGRGLLLGILDGRNTRLEDSGEVYERTLRPILERLRAARGQVGEVHLVPNHGLEFLPRETARAKLVALAALRDRARQEFG